MYGQDTSVPVRESELNREYSKLLNTTECLEKVKEVLFSKLARFLNGGGLKDGETPKNPENSSKFGQELNTMNSRLGYVLKELNDLADRLEV